MKTNAASQCQLALTLLLMSLMAGCVVVPAHRYYSRDVVMVEPPAPRVEVVGVAPYPGYIWLGGYWRWNGNRHEWIEGHWQAPRPGYRWAPHHWVHERNGWYLSEGHWERR